MKVDAEKKVGQTVAEDYRAADIFKKYGIDFCCGGGVTIAEACQKKRINPQDVVDDLAALFNKPENGLVDFNLLTLHDLAEKIVNKHHDYIRTNAPLLSVYLKKIYAVHGQNHPELEEVFFQFQQSAHELAMHMKKEEEILFPYIKKLEAALTSDESDKPQLDLVIGEMLNEHENEGQRFARIKEITNDYQFPEDACNTYKVAYHKLKEFQDDLHLHIHLENNILFPKAMQMEKELISNT